MSRYEMIYHNPSQRRLDKIIEADTYRVSGKFFEFIVDKEVVRSLKVDLVSQIRRMAEDEEGDESVEAT